MWWLITGVLIETVLGLCCLRRMRQECRAKQKRSIQTMLSVWILFILHSSLIAYAAWKPVFRLPLNGTASLIVGGVAIAAGLAIALAGFVEFRSIRRMSGVAVDRLITSGIYRRSRNPQNVGWALLLLGIATAGRSLASLVLATAYLVIFRLYIRLEEEHLEWVYGEEWRAYRERTARFFRFPGQPSPMPAVNPISPLFSENPPRYN